jgi:hypothetical protein
VAARIYAFELLRGEPIVSTRTARWLAWFVWLVSLATAALALLVLVLAPSTDPVLTRPDSRTAQVLSVFVPLGNATLYALIAWRQPGHSPTWVNTFWLLISGVTFWLLINLVDLAYYAWYVLGTNPRAGWTFGWLGWLANGLWVPIFSLIALLGLLFPTGRLPSRRRRPVAWALVMAPAVLGIAIVLYPDPLDITGWLFTHRVLAVQDGNWRPAG